MAKPWEETWCADSGRVYMDDEASYRVAVFDRRDPEAKSSELVELDYASARLAAASPEMARLLLDLEWVSLENEVWCPSCSAVERWDTPRPKREHTVDCRWLAVAKKAGLR